MTAVKREYGAGAPQQLEVRVAAIRGRGLFTHEDRALEQPATRERVRAAQRRVLSRIHQDEDTIGRRGRERPRMDGRRDTLAAELVGKRRGELVEEVILGRGGHERDVRHRTIVATASRVATATDSLSRVHDDLAGAPDGSSERFVPEYDRGRLIEVERVARYRWAAQIAEGRAVLDAGCGTGYGSAILADAGASEVRGVDIAAAMLETIAPRLPASVLLEPGDVRSLQFEDARFDLIVCFEVIEHLHEPFAALDELVRVLAPDGILLLSSPNRGVYPPGNPHHRHEFVPHELAAALRERLPHVDLMRQTDHLVSAVLSDETLRVGDGGLANLDIHKLESAQPGSEIYTVAIASRAPLPALRELAALTGTLEMREWLSVFDVQTRAIGEKDDYIAELEERLGERDRLAELLTESELRLAYVPEHQARIAELELELESARSDAETAHREARELDRALLYGRRVLRHARPLVQLLRRIRRRLRHQ